MNSVTPPLHNKILIVEDESVIRNLIKRILGQDIYQLSLACTIQEGTDWIQREDFDLLLTDLRLPDGSGTEIIQQFKAKFPGAGVLVMTGSLTPEERLARIPNDSILACIQKPFTVEILQKTIADALQIPHEH
jgi:DNA-binding NtrC family response regulator